ncbi:MAG: hypothetical protein ACP5O3_01975 [Candidatus Micrarchaeia archaeon]
MKMNKVGFLAFGIAVMAFAGLAAAAPAYITGAQNTTDWSTATPYTGQNAGSLPVTAGYIYNTVLSGTSVTEYWAGLYGKISGSITLASNDSGTVHTMKNWTYNGGNGYIYAVKGSTVPDWWNLTNMSGADIDTAFNFTSSDADSASNTFMSINAPVKIANQTIIIQYCTLTKNTTSDHWPTCAAKDNTNLQPIFAGALENNAELYNGGQGDFQIIVPNNQRGVSNATTYYFYLELH